MIDICWESAENRDFCCLFAASAMCCVVFCLRLGAGCGGVRGYAQGASLPAAKPRGTVAMLGNDEIDYIGGQG